MLVILRGKLDGQGAHGCRNKKKQALEFEQALASMGYAGDYREREDVDQVEAQVKHDSVVGEGGKYGLLSTNISKSVQLLPKIICQNGQKC